MIETYATDDSTTLIKDNFYWDILRILDTIKSHQDIILAGDLNAMVGSRQNDTVVGKFGEAIVNESGGRLQTIRSTDIEFLFFTQEHPQIHMGKTYSTAKISYRLYNSTATI